MAKSNQLTPLPFKGLHLLRICIWFWPSVVDNVGKLLAVYILVVVMLAIVCRQLTCSLHVCRSRIRLAAVVWKPDRTRSICHIQIILYELAFFHRLLCRDWKRLFLVLCCHNTIQYIVYYVVFNGFYLSLMHRCNYIMTTDSLLFKAVRVQW